MLADATGDVAALELAGDRACVRRPEAGADVLFHSNAYCTPMLKEAEAPAETCYTDAAPAALRGRRVMESPERRDARLTELLQAPRRLDASDLAGIMADHGADGAPDDGTICMHSDYWSTTASLQWFPVERKVRVAYGPACRRRTRPSMLKLCRTLSGITIVQQSPRVRENLVQHGFSQSPGESILLAGVITTDQPAVVLQTYNGAVAELRARTAAPTPLGNLIQRFFPCDLTQSDQHARVNQVQSLLQPTAACNQFVCSWLVVWRRAVAHRRYRAVIERQAIIGRDGTGLIGETRLVERAIQPIAAPVPSEHPAGPIGAVSRGRQADNQELCPRVAKVRDGLAPVVPFPIGASLFGGNLGAILAEPGTLPATNDARVQPRPTVH
jgi:hypothetical protein